jgi:hypothetical protein
MDGETAAPEFESQREAAEVIRGGALLDRLAPIKLAFARHLDSALSR